MYGPCVDRESTATNTPPRYKNASVVVPLAKVMRCSPAPSPVYTFKWKRHEAAGCQRPSAHQLHARTQPVLATHICRCREWEIRHCIHDACRSLVIPSGHIRHAQGAARQHCAVFGPRRRLGLAVALVANPNPPAATYVPRGPSSRPGGQAVNAFALGSRLT